MILGVNAIKGTDTGSQDVLFNKSKTRDNNFSNVFEKKINDLSTKSSDNYKKQRVNNFDRGFRKEVSQVIDSKESKVDNDDSAITNKSQANDRKEVQKESKIDDKLKKLIDESLEDGIVTDEELKNIKEVAEEIISMLANGENNQQIDENSLTSLLKSLELIIDKINPTSDSQLVDQEVVLIANNSSMQLDDSKTESGLQKVVESIKDLISNTDDIKETVNSAEFKELMSKLTNELNEINPKEKLQVISEAQVETKKPEVKLENFEESKTTEEIKADVIKVQKTVTGKENIQEDVKVHAGKEEATKGESLNAEVKSVDEKGNIITDKNVEVLKFENTLIRSARIDNPQRSQSFESNIIRQVVNFAKSNFKVSESGSEMVLKLKPNNLGEVSLKIAIDKGVIQAEMNVENQTVKQVLESNLTDLRNALSDKGFTLGALDVSVGKDSSGNNQDNSKSFKNKNKFFDILDMEEEESNAITSDYSTTIDTLR